MPSACCCPIQAMMAVPITINIGSANHQPSGRKRFVVRDLQIGKQVYLSSQRSSNRELL